MSWRGMIPAGTLLSNDDRTAATLARCEVAEDFTITDSSIQTTLDFGGTTLIVAPYQDMRTRNWAFIIPRPGSVQWVVTDPMRIIPADVIVSAPYLAWVRFSDAGTAINDAFDDVAGLVNVRASERFRTFVVDSFVSADWHEGDYIESQGAFYVIQARRILSARENEFDAITRPQFRLSAPPEVSL